MDQIRTRDGAAAGDPVCSPRAVDATAAASALLARAHDGDGLLVASLATAPPRHVELTPAATAVLHESLLRIVTNVVDAPDAVVPWVRDQVLALLAGASAQARREVGDEIRARWRQAWQAPVTVVTVTATVDPATPPAVAAFVAGARLADADDACAHA